MATSPRMIIGALVLALVVGALCQGTAQAQPPYPRNYALSCTGSACTTSTCTAAGPVVLVGRMQLSSAVAGTGSVAANANFGSLIAPSTAYPFTVRIINGTATQTSSGGNGIPIGCFAALFTVPSFLNNTFGCYSDTQYDFDLVPLVKNGGTLSCHAKLM